MVSAATTSPTFAGADAETPQSSASQTSPESVQSPETGHRPNASANDTGAQIDIQGVSHWFGSRQAPLQVLDGVDLHVAPGEFVALLGPSGCGKSTLLRLVAGLETATRGAIQQDGADITRPDPSRIVVFQDPTLYPWRTVRDNVALGLQARGVLAKERPRVDAALARVGLSEFADAFPHQLSGGMAQRVALARALVNDPRLLVLDEPLGKLDSLTRLAMQSELVDLWQRAGFSALLVTHDVEEALFLAQRVIVFSARPARIVAELRVDLPYPRHRGDPRITELRHEALRHLGLDASW
ncbi:MULTISPECIES: ABC transporter ATP-binding protein [Pandoraea]|uniref:ABC transporter ATP-binding protein n=1 Tax=Pandoraea TaxID=93217 RepID=UPI001F5E348B|nr:MULTISPECIES: ABC transporter ATP-binding protein [Pandoraea]MCI3205550.1 ABC transporter [Pandoraea sp. LA3]MDN4583578.1 ABC transporter [Pandoraea capi]